MGVPSLVPPVLHPLVVHFPIALIPSAAALMTFVAWKRPAWGRNMVLVVLGLAAVASIVAAQLGDSEMEQARQTMTPEVRAIARTHDDLGTKTEIAAVALFAAAIVLRRWVFGTPWAWLFAAALWALFVLVSVTAWYGGSLVYEHGVSTPPHA